MDRRYCRVAQYSVFRLHIAVWTSSPRGLSTRASRREDVSGWFTTSWLAPRASDGLFQPFWLTTVVSRGLLCGRAVIGVLSKLAGFDNCNRIRWIIRPGRRTEYCVSLTQPSTQLSANVSVVFIELTFPEKALESEREREMLFIGMWSMSGLLGDMLRCKLNDTKTD